jgi:hypothetical protein
VRDCLCDDGLDSESVIRDLEAERRITGDPPSSRTPERGLPLRDREGFAATSVVAVFTVLAKLQARAVSVTSPSARRETQDRAWSARRDNDR